MARFSKIRVPYFKELLLRFKKEKPFEVEREITRKPDNPLLRFNKNGAYQSESQVHH